MDRNICPIEDELTMRLERAHELAERAQRSNDAMHEQLERAREITSELLRRVDASKRTA